MRWEREELVSLDKVTQHPGKHSTNWVQTSWAPFIFLIYGTTLVTSTLIPKILPNWQALLFPTHFKFLKAYCHVAEAIKDKSLRTGNLKALQFPELYTKLGSRLNIWFYIILLVSKWNISVLLPTAQLRLQFLPLYSYHKYNVDVGHPPLPISLL